MRPEKFKKDWGKMTWEEKRKIIKRMKDHGCDERSFFEKFIDIVNVPAWIGFIVIGQIIIALLQAYFTLGGW